MIKNANVNYDPIMGLVKLNEYESSTLDSTMYLADSKTLIVTFKNGTSYSYKDVDGETYTQFVLSESHGSALNKLIKNKFETTKIEK
jgi:hypothetical protein